MARQERVFRKFTPEELKIISDSNGKVTLADLAVKLDFNYTNLCTAIKQHRVFFNPLRTERIIPTRVSSALSKSVDDSGKELLTDKLMKSWFQY